LNKQEKRRRKKLRKYLSVFFWVDLKSLKRKNYLKNMMKVILSNEEMAL